MANVLITAPAAEPVTLTEAKAHLYVTHTDDDTLIAAYISAARDDAEHRLGRLLIDQTWELSLGAFPSVIVMPVPIASVTSIKYIDTDGVEQTLDPATYQVDTAALPGVVAPAYGAAWPSTRDQYNAVKVRYTAGYGADSTTVPATIRAWILLRIGSLYENRESAVSGQPITQAPRDFSDALLDRYKVYA